MDNRSKLLKQGYVSMANCHILKYAFLFDDIFVITRRVHRFNGYGDSGGGVHFVFELALRLDQLEATFVQHDTFNVMLHTTDDLHHFLSSDSDWLDVYEQANKLAIECRVDLNDFAALLKHINNSTKDLNQLIVYDQETEDQKRQVQTIREQLTANHDCSFSEFEAILHEEQFQEHFFRFLLSRMCSENFRFWLAVEEFHTLNDAQQLQESAQSIYETFLDVDCCFEISIDSQERSAILQAITTNPNVAMFDVIQLRALVELKNGPLMEFMIIQSKEIDSDNNHNNHNNKHKHTGRLGVLARLRHFVACLFRPRHS